MLALERGAVRAPRASDNPQIPRRRHCMRLPRICPSDTARLRPASKLQRLSEMIDGDPLGAVEIGDRARDAEYAIE